MNTLLSINVKRNLDFEYWPGEVGLNICQVSRRKRKDRRWTLIYVMMINLHWLQDFYAMS
jgi:hypothetical protein